MSKKTGSSAATISTTIHRTGDATIGPENESTETYEVHLPSDDTLDIEYVSRDDWEGLLDPCPECQGTEFDHMRYEGGHYGHHEDAVIQRTDYWDQKGSLYTACKSCDEVLYKHPAYDLLKVWSDHEFQL